MASSVSASGLGGMARLRHLALAVAIASLAGGAFAQARAAVKGSAPAGNHATAPVSRPTWSELNTVQREALAPLAPHWDGLTENHKRKWLAISRNFDRWPAEEQTKMHGRMSAWAGLSAVERDQARLNFAEARKLPVDEKKARWEAYQALSDEQRDKLASSSTAVPRRPGAAAPARLSRPAELVKLVPAGGDPRGPVRVGVPASAVDHNTLLPQQVQAP